MYFCGPVSVGACTVQRNDLIYAGSPKLFFFVAQSASVRAQCSAILLMFLLDYPLGEQRLEHHLDFLVANLEFEHESGREAAIDAMIVSHPLLMLVHRYYGNAICASSECTRGDNYLPRGAQLTFWHFASCRAFQGVCRCMLS